MCQALQTLSPWLSPNPRRIPQVWSNRTRHRIFMPAAISLDASGDECEVHAQKG